MANCDVAGLLGLAVGHVLAAAEDGDDAQVGLEQGDGAHGSDHGGGAAHVVLHLLHAVGGLDADAAGVKGDSLADQSEDGRGGGAGRFVAHDDEARFFLRTLGDAPECSHLEFLDLVGAIDLAGEADFGAHGAGALGEDGGSHEVAGFQGEGAGEVLRLGKDGALGDGRSTALASALAGIARVTSVSCWSLRSLR